MKYGKSKVIIVILSVLLAIVSCALVITLIELNNVYAQGSSIVPGNKIERQEQTEALPCYVKSARAVMTADYELSESYADVQMSAAFDGEKIRLSEDDIGSATPIEIDDMFPGDSFTKKYIVSVSDGDAAVIFSADFHDNTVNPTEAQKNRDRSLMKMVIKANGTEIYNGKLDSVDSAAFAPDGAKKITYEITVSLDTSAGNEYSGLTLGMDFHWAAGVEQTYRVIYTDGVNGAAFATQEYIIKPTDAIPMFSGTPRRNGYVFIGWIERIDGITSGVVYTASWMAVTPPTPPTPPEPIKYTVVYTDGVPEEDVFADKIFSGILPGEDTPSFGENPSREGYTFDGWYPEISEKVTRNVTYTAQWTPVAPPEPARYTVIYTDGVDGEEIFEDVIFAGLSEGTPTPSFPVDLKREGYTFAGWHPEVTETVSANVTYVAQWHKDEIPQEELTLIVDEDSSSACTEIRLENLPGGASREYKYKMVINADGFYDLYFGCRADEKCDGIYITVVCDETEDVLYSGLLKDIPQSLRTTISGNRGEELHYTVEVSLDETFQLDYVANIYLEWEIRGKESCHCGICAAVRQFGGPDCICPWCRIILILLILLICLIILIVLLKRRIRKKIIDARLASAVAGDALSEEYKKNHPEEKPDSFGAEKHRRRKKR